VTGLVVLDASALVAMLLDAGEVGDWVAERRRDTAMAAPELALFETANVLRRQAAAGRISSLVATLAHSDLLALELDLWPYAPLAERVWELRGSLSVFDASYVALAELLDGDLLTLDVKLSRAPGPRCRVRTPPAT